MSPPPPGGRKRGNKEGRKKKKGVYAPVSVQDGSRTHAQNVADAGRNGRADERELPSLYVVPHTVRTPPYCCCRLGIHQRLQASLPSSVSIAGGNDWGGGKHEGGRGQKWICRGVLEGERGRAEGQRGLRQPQRILGGAKESGRASRRRGTKVSSRQAQAYTRWKRSEGEAREAGGGARKDTRIPRMRQKGNQRTIDVGGEGVEVRKRVWPANWLKKQLRRRAKIHTTTLLLPFSPLSLSPLPLSRAPGSSG